MGLRYTTSFNSYNAYTGINTVYDIEIDDINFSGEPTELTAASNPLECEYQNTARLAFPEVVPSYLTINLIATNGFELNNIYTDNERALKVTVKKGGVIWNQYFVIPDGTSEYFIDPPYEVQIRCIDGLGLLKNFAYTNVTGQASVLNVISRCLAKLGLNLNINTFCTLYYDGMVSNSDPYLNTMINQERFEGMQCDEVLKQLMKEWVSGIMQIDGEWYLFRYPDIISHPGVVTFKRYDYQLNVLGTNVRDIDLILGNRMGDIIHAKHDQSRSVNMPYKQVSIRYEYGYFKNLLDSATTFLIGTPLVFNGWDKNGSISAEPRSLLSDQLEYAIINGRTTSYSETRFLDLKSPVNVTGIDRMKLDITFNVNAANSMAYMVVYRDNSQTLYLRAGGTPEDWGTPLFLRLFDNYEQADGNSWGKGQTIRGEIDFALPTVRDGAATIDIRLYPSYFKDNNKFTGHPGLAKVYEVNLYPISNERDIIAETHTVVNNGNYTNVPNVIEVSTGESQFSGYLGTMFKINGITPTDGYTRAYGGGKAPFLQIAAQDILFQHGRPMGKYEGTILGIFPFLSRIKINEWHDPAAVFMPTNLRYNFKESTVMAVLSEVNASSVPNTVSGVTYEYEDAKETEGGNVG